MCFSDHTERVFPILGSTVEEYDVSGQPKA